MIVFDLRSLLDGLRPEILNLFRDEPDPSEPVSQSFLLDLE